MLLVGQSGTYTVGVGAAFALASAIPLTASGPIAVLFTITLPIIQSSVPFTITAAQNQWPTTITAGPTADLLSASAPIQVIGAGTITPGSLSCSSGL